MARYAVAFYNAEEDEVAATIETASSELEAALLVVNKVGIELDEEPEEYEDLLEALSTGSDRIDVTLIP